MVSFVHGVVTLIHTYKDALLVGKGSVVVQKQPLFSPQVSVEFTFRYCDCGLDCCTTMQ